MLYESLRWLHILAGGISLIAGLAAMGLFQRTSAHRPMGKVFFYSMSIVFVTAVVLAVRGGLNFLLCIAFLSYYSVYRGVRAMRLLKGATIQWHDYAAPIVVMLCGTYLIYTAVEALYEESWAGTMVYGAFGVLSNYLGIEAIRELRRVPSRDKRWFRTHKSAMGGGLIATMTAFTVTALSFLPDLLAWLGPTLVFTPVLSWIIRYSESPKRV